MDEAVPGQPLTKQSVTVFNLSDPVIFVIGGAGREIWLPRNAAFRSPFLKAALEWPSDSDTTPKRIKLEGIRPEDFEVYGNWLLSKHLPHIPEYRTKHFSERLINLWLLGDFVQDTGFKNCIIDSMIKRHCKDGDPAQLEVVPNIHALARKWLQIPENSGLHRLMLDMYVGVGASHLESSKALFRDGAGSAFLYDLCVREKRTKHWFGLEEAHKYYDMDVNQDVADHPRRPECIILD